MVTWIPRVVVKCIFSCRVISPPVLAVDRVESDRNLVDSAPFVMRPRMADIADLLKELSADNRPIHF